MVSSTVEVLNGCFAEVRELPCQLVQFVTAEHVLLALRPPSHDRTILACSPILRLAISDSSLRTIRVAPL